MEIRVEVRTKVDAKAWAAQPKAELGLYTDASIKDGVASIGIWHAAAEAPRNVGPAEFLHPLHAELQAITQAVMMAPAEHPVIFYTDCKHAVEALNDKRRTDTTSARY